MTYDSVYNDTERNPNDERKENHGSCNVNFQELAKFTRTAKAGQKRLYKSVLGIFRTRFLEKQIVRFKSSRLAHSLHHHKISPARTRHDIWSQGLLHPRMFVTLVMYARVSDGNISIKNFPKLLFCVMVLFQANCWTLVRSRLKTHTFLSVFHRSSTLGSFSKHDGNLNGDVLRNKRIVHTK